MNNNEFSSILNESQKQFTDLFQENNVTNTVKKAASTAANTISKGAKFVGSGVKAASAAGVSIVKDKIAAKTKDKITSKDNDKTPPKKSKSELDKLDTVSKNSDKDGKVKEGIKKVASETKKVASDPIKASTAVGVALGGVAGGAVGFGVGAMVKDISDGVKEVKGKLMENHLFEQLLFESNNQFTQLFESVDVTFNMMQANTLNKDLPNLIKLLDSAYINGQIDRNPDNDPIYKLFLKHNINIYQDFEVLRAKLEKFQKDLDKTLDKLYQG